MSKAYEFDVFLSHNRSQKDWTRELARRLRSDNFRVWFDEWELPKHAGENWVDLLALGVEQSRKIILVWSPQFFANDWPLFEANMIQHLDPLGRQGRIIPLLHTDCEIPIKWGFRQRLTFIECSIGSAEFEFAYQMLVHNLDPTRFVVPDAERFRPEKLRFAKKVASLGRLWNISALCGTLCAILFLAVRVLSSDWLDKAVSPGLIAFSLIITMVSVVIARGLNKLRPWGRTAAIMLSIFVTIWYPLSWYTLWVFFQTEAKKLYAEIVEDAR